MNISPAGLLSVAVPGGAGAAPAWQTGQVLSAVVLAQHGPALSLRIGGHTVETVTHLTLAPQSRLQLEVVQGGSPALLRVLPPPAAADPLGAALRNVLPRQAPLAEVFAALGTLASPLQAAALPPPALALLGRLYAALPAAAAVAGAAGLKQALRDSGLLLEQRIARGATARLERDLKANLLRLLGALGGDGDAPLQRLLGAAVARIELHQLAALAQPAADPAYTVELPLRGERGVDVIALRLEREARAGADTGHDWTVWLHAAAAPVGPLHAKVGVRGDAVGVTLWVEEAAGAALIERQLPQLTAALGGAGLHVRRLQCYAGRPPHDPFADMPAARVDVSA